MSAEQAEILDGIKGKLQSVKHVIREKEELARNLEERNDELQHQLQQKQSQIEELEEKNQKLILMKSIATDSPDSRDAQVQITRIVREIDRCIALLNRS